MAANVIRALDEEKDPSYLPSGCTVKIFDNERKSMPEAGSQER